MGKLYRPSLDRRVGDEYLLPPCTQNPEMFTQWRSRKEAQKVCVSCPVKMSCLLQVLHEEKDPGGVYGGLTEENRDDLRKRIQCQPIGS